jgi:hypothetical protein
MCRKYGEVMSDAGSAFSFFPAYENHLGEQFKNKSKPGLITAKQLHQNHFKKVCATRCVYKRVCAHMQMCFPSLRNESGGPAHIRSSNSC